MIDIDWSKCPQATHFAPKPEADDMWCDVFWRVVDGVGVEAWALVSGGLEHYSRPTWRKETAERLIARPPQWNGDGLPPVGAACEMCGSGAWYVVTMLGAGKQAALIQYDDGQEHAVPIASVKFRPIRTAEQIAAEERTKAIDDMVKALGMDEPGTAEYIRCGLIYDAGYRKQVQP